MVVKVVCVSWFLGGEWDMRSPICWLGGKGLLVRKLLPLVPRHRIYVEVFGGGASLLLAKDAAVSEVEVYNDLDSRLVNLFEVLREPENFKEFERRAVLTPFGREVFVRARDSREVGKVESAWAFFVRQRQSFGGMGESFGATFASSSRGMCSGNSRWLGAIAGLPELHERLMRVQIECDDWRKILDRYDSAETFFYLDPPYVASSRRSGGYRCELGDDDHKELVDRVLGLKGRVLLSGYPNGIYQPLERVWNSRRWDVVCNAAGRTRGNGMMGAGNAKKKQPRIEAVWMNYEVG